MPPHVRSSKGALSGRKEGAASDAEAFRAPMAASAFFVRRLLLFLSLPLPLPLAAGFTPGLGFASFLVPLLTVGVGLVGLPRARWGRALALATVRPLPVRIYLFVYVYDG